MITTADLKTQTRRDLAELAREYGIAGWHSMRKADLISELTRVQRNARRRSSAASKSTSERRSPKSGSSKSPKPKSRTVGAKGGGSSVNKAAASRTRSKAKPKKQPKAATKTGPSATARVSLSRAARILRQRQQQAERYKDLSTTSMVKGHRSNGPADEDAQRDRVVLLVRDSFWLQANWEVSRGAVERAKAALAEHWHAARPVLRVLRVSNGAGANATEQLFRDIPIHGGVSTWYIDVSDPPSRFCVVLGYLSPEGKMFTIARSNIVGTPAVGSCDSLNGHWEDIAEDYERIYAMSGGGTNDAGADLKDLFEKRLSRSMQGQESGMFGSPADVSLRRSRELPFEVDAELIIYGRTQSGAAVTLAGEPVKLRPDGSFTVRMELPDRRQVLPVVAYSRDGMRQRTTVVAVERNTKVMEPVDNEPDE